MSYFEVAPYCDQIKELDNEQAERKRKEAAEFARPLNIFPTFEAAADFMVARSGRRLESFSAAYLKARRQHTKCLKYISQWRVSQ